MLRLTDKVCAIRIHPADLLSCMKKSPDWVSPRLGVRFGWSEEDLEGLSVPEVQAIA
jgi:hypothetical protein